MSFVKTYHCPKASKAHPERKEWADIVLCEGENDFSDARSFKVEQAKSHIGAFILIDADHPELDPAIDELARPIGEDGSVQHTPDLLKEKLARAVQGAECDTKDLGHLARKEKGNP